MKNVFNFMKKRLSENYTTEQIEDLTLFTKWNNVVAVLTKDVINLFLSNHDNIHDNINSEIFILTITKDFKRVENTDVKIIDAITITKLRFPFNFFVNDNNKIISKDFILPNGKDISTIGFVIIKKAVLEVYFHNDNFRFMFKLYCEKFDKTKISIHYLEEKKSYALEPNDPIYPQCFEKYENRNRFYEKNDHPEKIRHYLVNYHNMSKGFYIKLWA